MPSNESTTLTDPAVVVTTIEAGITTCAQPVPREPLTGPLDAGVQEQEVEREGGAAGRGKTTFTDSSLNVTVAGPAAC